MYFRTWKFYEERVRIGLLRFGAKTNETGENYWIEQIFDGLQKNDRHFKWKYRDGSARGIYQIRLCNICFIKPKEIFR